jgi:hypothetical protein
MNYAIPDVVRIPEVDHEQTDALYNVLTLPHKQKLKEAQEYKERMVNMPPFPTPDFSTMIDNLTKERDLIYEQMATFDNLEEPMRSIMSAYLKPQAEMSLKRIEDQLDSIQKQMEGQ